MSVKTRTDLRSAVKEVNDLDTGKVQARALSRLSAEIPLDHPGWLVLEQNIDNIFPPDHTRQPSIKIDLNGDGKVQLWEKLVAFLGIATSIALSILGVVLNR